jgi:spore coat polysaccharide biosynthesis protein SpsF
MNPVDNYFQNDLAIILTARLSSERLPGKALLPVAGKPLISWIAERLSQVGRVILATSDGVEDQPLIDWADDEGYPWYAGDKDDVVSRMHHALLEHAPNAQFVMRGLGDMAFPSVEMLSHAVTTMRAFESDIRLFALAPYAEADIVYGSRESPFSRQGWECVYRNSQTREHVDQFFHEHRDLFKPVYHEAPPSVYFRNYRLEVDWQNDLDMVKGVADEIGMLADVPTIIRFLDEHPEIAKLNHDRVERTGLTTYDYATQRVWMKQLQGQRIVTWSGQVLCPPTDNAQTVFCKSGRHFLGYGVEGTLHLPNGTQIRNGYIKCDCSVLAWQPKISNSKWR